MLIILPAHGAPTREGRMNGTKRIVVAAADGLGLDGQVSLHFGHSPAVVVVDVADGEIRESRIVATPSAGGEHQCGMPTFIARLRADVVVAGGMGPGAIQALTGSGIVVATGASGRVRDAVSTYLQGDLGVGATCKGGHGGSGCHGH
jgi:predicted Fe-Mo cluster-binding NifX family protein